MIPKDIFLGLHQGVCALETLQDNLWLAQRYMDTCHKYFVWFRSLASPSMLDGARVGRIQGLSVRLVDHTDLPHKRT
jgi:hypothetical protein